MIQHETGIVLGVDAGYSARGRTTGLCVIRWNIKTVTWTCTDTKSDAAARLADLESLVAVGEPLVAVAIDGPLRPNLAVDTSSYRACEALLSRGEFQKRGKPGPTNGGSGLRLHREATSLAKLVLGCRQVGPARGRCAIHPSAIAEAFPNMFLGVLCDEAKYPECATRKWTDSLYPVARGRLEAMLRKWFSGRSIEGSFDIHGHEEIASFVCAVTALSVLADDYVAVGSFDDGWIILPGRSHWGSDGTGAPWAWRELETNRRSVADRFPTAAVI